MVDAAVELVEHPGGAGVAQQARGAADQVGVVEVAQIAPCGWRRRAAWGRRAAEVRRSRPPSAARGGDPRPRGPGAARPRMMSWISGCWSASFLAAKQETARGSPLSQEGAAPIAPVLDPKLGRNGEPPSIGLALSRTPRRALGVAEHERLADVGLRRPGRGGVQQSASLAAAAPAARRTVSARAARPGPVTAPAAPAAASSFCTRLPNCSALASPASPCSAAGGASASTSPARPPSSTAHPPPRPAGNAARLRLPAESAAAATGRRRGSCRCASRLAGRARARTSSRALARLRSPASARSSANSRSRVLSSAVAHSPSRVCRRSAISAAAALVKVRHWMRPGSAPASIRRRMRSVSSLVLPDPAEASTKAETRGSDASAVRGWRAGGRGSWHSPPAPPIRRRARAGCIRRSGARAPGWGCER